eukprot:230637_1
MGNDASNSTEQKDNKKKEYSWNWGYNKHYQNIDRPRPSLINGQDPCLINQFVSGQDSDKIYEKLKDDIPWTKNPKWSFGYKLPQNAYYYDENIRKKKENQITILEELLTKIEQEFKCNIFTVWCNYFEDGNQFIDWHQDQYGYDCFTLSFGIERKFLMRNKKTKKQVADYDLKNGDLYFFSQATDKENEHCVPQNDKCNKGRISILFFTDWPLSKQDGYIWDPLKCKYVE